MSRNYSSWFKTQAIAIRNPVPAMIFVAFLQVTSLDRRSEVLQRKWRHCCIAPFPPTSFSAKWWLQHIVFGLTRTTTTLPSDMEWSRRLVSYSCVYHVGFQNYTNRHILSIRKKYGRPRARSDIATIGNVSDSLFWCAFPPLLLGLMLRLATTCQFVGWTSFDKR